MKQANTLKTFEARMDAAERAVHDTKAALMACGMDGLTAVELLSKIQSGQIPNLTFKT